MHVWQTWKPWDLRKRTGFRFSHRRLRFGLETQSCALSTNRYKILIGQVVSEQEQELVRQFVGEMVPPGVALAEVTT